MADVRCLLREASLISKNEPAVLEGDRVLRYSELDALVSEAAVKLRASGIHEGDRVAIHLPNGAPAIVALLAVIRRGAVAVPLNPRWPADLVRRQLAALDVPVVIAAPGSLPGLPVLDAAALAAWSGGELGGWSERIPIDRPATLVFTSGSAGAPRAAVLTYGNHYYSALGANVNLSVRSHDRWLLTLPLCHVGGLGVLFRVMRGGAGVVIPAPGETLPHAQEKYGVTHVSLVATQLRRMLAEPSWPKSFRALRAVVLGGGEVPPGLVAEAWRRGLPVYASYGLTEMASQVTTVGPDSPADARASSGRLLRHRELRIAADGEILVRGATLFAGYATADGIEPAVDADGWYATGDLGRVDERGFLHVAGRKDNLFISGGENIQPEAIEAALRELAGVDDALVVPVPDADFGARPAVFLRAARPWEALAAELARQLPKFMIPVAAFPWPDDLDVPAAKAPRAMLRERAAARRRDAGA
jgi:O-succinylbenzoic acid--CoA ligase